MIAVTVTPTQKAHIWNVFAPLLIKQKNHKSMLNIYLKDGLIGETHLTPAHQEKGIKWVTYKTFYNTVAFYA